MKEVCVNCDSTNVELVEDAIDAYGNQEDEAITCYECNECECGFFVPKCPKCGHIHTTFREDLDSFKCNECEEEFHYEY